MLGAETTDWPNVAAVILIHRVTGQKETFARGGAYPRHQRLFNQVEAV